MPMSAPVLISICIPSYNSGKYIERTIQSVLDQTYPHFELIVCDDASPDDTVARVKTFSDTRIRLIENAQNRGLTANWNAAVAQANGEYVKLLCGDDLLAPQCLELQVAAFSKSGNEHIALVSCAANIIDQRGTLLFRRKLFLRNGINAAQSVLRKTAILGTNIIGEPMVGLYRRSALASCRYDGSNPYMIDLDFWAQVLEHGDLFCIDQPLTSFRISGDSLSASLNVRQYRLFCAFIAKLSKKGRLSWLFFAVTTMSALGLAIARNIVFLHVRRKAKHNK